jgi:hypothetical protein
MRVSHKKEDNSDFRPKMHSRPTDLGQRDRSMAWAAEITNIPTGKKFVVSTVDTVFGGSGVWQTAVFRKRFGPLSACFKPVLKFQSGVLGESSPYLQHQRIIELVQKISPTDWEDITARWRVAVAAYNAPDNDTFIDELLDALGNKRSEEAP